VQTLFYVIQSWFCLCMLTFLSKLWMKWPFLQNLVKFTHWMPPSTEIYTPWMPPKLWFCSFLQSVLPAWLHHLANCVTTWSIILLEKLEITCILYNLTVYYNVHKSLQFVPIETQIHSVRSHPVSLRSILISVYDQSVGLFPSGFPTKPANAIPFCPMHATVSPVLPSLISILYNAGCPGLRYTKI